MIRLVQISRNKKIQMLPPLTNDRKLNYTSVHPSTLGSTRKVQKIFQTQNYSQNRQATTMRVLEEKEELDQVQQRDQFYRNLSKNKVVVIPGQEILNDAEQLSMPYFSIIEIPIKKYPMGQNDNQQSKPMNQSYNKTNQSNQGSINLFWQINDESFKHIKQKYSQSPSTKVKKFKYKSEVIPFEEPSIISDQYMYKDEGKINVMDDQPKRKLNDLSLKKESLNLSNKLSSSPSSITRRESLFKDQVKAAINNELARRIYKYEYDKLKKQIIYEKENEKKMKLITDLVKQEEGQISGKPKYKYQEFNKRISQSPSIKNLIN